MTKAKRALAVLSSGNKTVQQLKDEMGIDGAEYRALIEYLQMRGYIETIPLSYQLTPEGVKRHNFKPKSSPQKIAQVHKRNQAVRAKAKQESQISNAIHSQPNSVFALGSQGATQ